MTPAKSVSAQYERHPYPRLPWFALPSVAQAHVLSYELGQYLRTGRFIEHTKETRILVAGCGTFEPIVVARAHPRATITAVDVSARSLRQLKTRSWLTGQARRISTLQADLHDDLLSKLGQFDYIICTGVIHHSNTPDILLSRLTSLLKPTGVFRLMTYAAHSRSWIYETQKLFQLSKTRANRRECVAILNRLPSAHPLRSAFETYDDAFNQAGLVDGFFHVFDRPLKIHELKQLANENHLALLGFAHAWHSQPQGFAAALKKAGMPEQNIARFKQLDAWQRLTLVDDCGELSVNPIFWLALNAEQIEIGTPAQTTLNPPLLKVRSASAPLLPLNNDELVADFHFKDLEQTQDLTRFIVGGCILGCDGRLPPELAAERVLSQTNQVTIDRASDVANSEGSFEFLSHFVSKTSLNTPIATSHRLFSLATSGRLLVPSPVRARALAQLRQAATQLGVRESDELSRLASALEPRINRQNHELPWLSAGDLLRDLQKRCGSEWARAFWSFPLPPTDTQWHTLLKEKTDKTLITLLERGAIEWFVKIEI